MGPDIVFHSFRGKKRALERNRGKSFDWSRSPEQTISEKGVGQGKENRVAGKRALSLSPPRREARGSDLPKPASCRPPASRQAGPEVHTADTAPPETRGEIRPPRSTHAPSTHLPASPPGEISSRTRLRKTQAQEPYVARVRGVRADDGIVGNRRSSCGHQRGRKPPSAPLRPARAGPNSNSWERQGSSGSAPTPEGVRRPRVDPKLAAAHAAWLAQFLLRTKRVACETLRPFVSDQPQKHWQLSRTAMATEKGADPGAAFPEQAWNRRSSEAPS